MRDPDFFAVTGVIILDTVRILRLPHATYPDNKIYLLQLSSEGIEHPLADPLIALWQDGNKEFLWRDCVWRQTTFDWRAVLLRLHHYGYPARGLPDGIIIPNGYAEFAERLTDSSMQSAFLNYIISECAKGTRTVQGRTARLLCTIFWVNNLRPAATRSV